MLQLSFKSPKQYYNFIKPSTRGGPCGQHVAKPLRLLTERQNQLHPKEIVSQHQNKDVYSFSHCLICNLSLQNSIKHLEVVQIIGRCLSLQNIPHHSVTSGFEVLITIGNKGQRIMNWMWGQKVMQRSKFCYTDSTEQIYFQKRVVGFKGFNQCTF